MEKLQETTKFENDPFKKKLGPEGEKIFKERVMRKLGYDAYYCAHNNDLTLDIVRFEAERIKSELFNNGAINDAGKLGEAYNFAAELRNVEDIEEGKVGLEKLAKLIEEHYA